MPSTQRKRAPSVLVPRMQHFRFDLNHYTAPQETVYDNLWEKLRYDHKGDVPNNAHLVMSIWGDPADKDNPWLMEGASSDETRPNAYAGADKKFVWMKLPQEAIDHLRKHGFVS